MHSIKLNNIFKFFNNGDEQVKTLNNLCIDINKGDVISITGASGTGKTTLLRIIALLDSFDEGSYILNGKKIHFKHDGNLAKYRNELFGYVPQDCGMIDKMSVYDNIAMPLYIRSSFDRTIEEKVYDMANKLNIESLLKKEAGQLSLGEKQRVAIARALIKRPIYFFADEPTASLDIDNKECFVELLNELHKNGTTIIIVTHDDYISKMCRLQLKMCNGILKII